MLDFATSAAIKRIYDRTKIRIDREVAKQGGTRELILEIRLLEKIDHILDASSTKEAESLADRAYFSVYIKCLAMRSRGQLSPRTPDTYLERAERAVERSKELWQNYIDSEGMEEEERAKIHARYKEKLEYVEHLQQYAQALEKDPTVPSFDLMFPKSALSEDRPPKEKKERKKRVQTATKKPTRRRKTR